MSKFDYLMASSPFRKEIKMNKKRYSVDKKLKKFEMIYGLLMLVLFFVFVIIVSRFYQFDAVRFLIAILFWVGLEEVIRYILLPKDINSYLQEINKGE